MGLSQKKLLQYKKFKKDLILRSKTDLHDEEFLRALSKIGNEFPIEVEFLIGFMVDKEKTPHYLNQLFYSIEVSNAQKEEERETYMSLK